MIEQIIDGIWEDLNRRIGHSYIHTLTKDKLKEINRSWRLIIRKAIAESSQDGNMDIDTLRKMDIGCGDKLSHSSSQAMLEETAAGKR
ncbi:hypothetical protein LCGC14_1866840 [marine sediment metagenome]|uniref:Uncharacterized protein n=1 Tax=marine sediment metagenome TaxID=412755 RepID=A0A0F9J4W0_9ZZZZ